MRHDFERLRVGTVKCFLLGAGSTDFCESTFSRTIAAGGAGLLHAEAHGQHQDGGHPEGCVDDGPHGGGDGSTGFERERQKGAARCYLAESPRTHERSNSAQQPSDEPEFIPAEVWVRHA